MSSKMSFCPSEKVGEAPQIEDLLIKLGLRRYISMATFLASVGGSLRLVFWQGKCPCLHYKISPIVKKKLGQKFFIGVCMPTPIPVFWFKMAEILKWNSWGDFSQFLSECTPWPHTHFPGFIQIRSSLGKL